MVLGARGWMHVELRVKGAANRVHSGNFGGLIPSPVLSLVKLLGSMVDERERVTIEGYRDDVAPPSALDRDAMAKLPFDQPAFMAAYRIARMGGDASLAPAERLMFQPHINIAGIQSGYTGAGFQSSIPNAAFAKLDLHFVANQDPDRCLDLLKRHIRRHCPDEVEVVRGGSMPPSRTPIDHPAVPVVFESLRAVWGEEPVIVPLLGEVCRTICSRVCCGCRAVGALRAARSGQSRAQREHHGRPFPEGDPGGGRDGEAAEHRDDLTGSSGAGGRSSSVGGGPRPPRPATVNPVVRAGTA